MKVENINIPSINIQSTPTKQAIHTYCPTNNTLLAYPKNYYISFGARSIAEIDIELMPTTVAEYIENNPSCENKTLREVQQEAFKELKNCHSISEIKEKFPTEKYFEDLFDEDKVKAENRKYVYVDSKGDLLPDGDFNGTKESVQCYLIREVFLKCKKYMEIADEFNEKTGGISNCNLHQKLENLYGVKIPDGRKYNLTLTAGKERQFTISEATRQKISENAKKRWEELSDEEKTARITQLQNGSKKQRVIMINAWNKIFNSGIPVRQNLSKFLSENQNGDTTFDAMLDSVHGVNDEKINGRVKMSIMMTKFWVKYPEYAKLLGKYIEKASSEYEAKCPNGVENEEYIKKILEEQNKINHEMKVWKKQQPLSSNELQSSFKTSMMKLIHDYMSK